jgi:cell division topological specificity factor
MANFFERLLGRNPASSANAAKERLQLVLIHDRTDISQAVMDQIKDEIIAVISANQPPE